MKEYPLSVKRNMRKRGPIESFKMDQHNKEVHASLKRMYSRVEQMKKGMNQYKEDIYHGKPYDAVQGTLQDRAYYVRRQIELLERGVKDV